MPTSYHVKDENALYYLTFATVGWVDVFTRKIYKDIIINSLEYCRQNKGLELYAYVVMSNHIHMVARAKEGYKLSGIMRDLKKHTSKSIVKTVIDIHESRKEWMQVIFKKSGKRNSNNKIYQLWQQDNHPIELYKAETIQQKVDYIHENPVRAGIVDKAEDYIYSSARNYAEKDYLIEIDKI